MRRPDGVPVQVERCPDGPVLVRGAGTVVDSDGEEHEVTRPVVALCTCGRSQRTPWCDGTHKFVRD
ncbi:MAG TPA: CDGSH iron-sulfur domain-containing protein [Marmoricola sp.]|nr:CDGSH iron-sulfur domain-containing protein [Marmoricola sp.]